MFIMLELLVESNSHLLRMPEGPLIVLKMVQHFCKASFLDAITQASQACTQNGDPSTESWYDDWKRTHGRWRGLFLVAGGAAVRFLKALEGLKSMVERPPSSSTFDFMMGFSTALPDPQLYWRAISHIIKNISVDKMDGIWDIVLWATGHDISLLRFTSVIFIHKDCGDTAISCRSIALHAPAIRSWGVEFTQCGTPGC
ncbi:hypothetical protein HD554DRAFT_2038318 [Boletus coccyginus]|nr:hypothetical protein HD554DRAFT_2038318 [Boletus coccyginus]